MGWDSAEFGIVGESLSEAGSSCGSVVSDILESLVVGGLPVFVGHTVDLVVLLEDWLHMGKLSLVVSIEYLHGTGGTLVGISDTAAILLDAFLADSSLDIIPLEAYVL